MSSDAPPISRHPFPMLKSPTPQFLSLHSPSPEPRPPSPSANIPHMDDDRGFFETFIGDGRSLIKLTALLMMGSGAFALFQAGTGHFLPQDTEYLGMTAAQLCTLHGCRIVHFMVHDRVSFGGVLLAIGVMYLWLAEFPLRKGESWAWWALAISGGAGFLSFLAYLGYGYLDSWHGAATLGLLPLFIAGLVLTRSLRVDRQPRPPLDFHSRNGL